MRLRLFLAVVMASSCTAAHADSFNLVGTNGDTLSFSIDHSPTPTYTSTTTTTGSRFDMDPVSVTIHCLASNRSIAFHDPYGVRCPEHHRCRPGSVGDDDIGLLIDTDETALFTGSISNLAFFPDTYHLIYASVLYGVKTEVMRRTVP